MFFDHLPGAGYVCAHRGARALAPENTMMAAELALELGADYWETDIHKLADGTLVVFHDDVLSRTTDISERSEFAGREWETASFSMEELRCLDAGSWFAARDPYGTIASGDVDQAKLEGMRRAKIPTLSEALAFSRKNDFPINIEIKPQLSSPGDLSIVGDLLQSIRDHEAEDLVLISSFAHEYLAEMNRIAPHIPLAVLVEEKEPEDVVSYLQSLGATTYHPDKDLIDVESVRALTKQGIRVAPWTVNDMDEAMSFIEAGCFGVITDYTHSLRQRLAE
ncbi:glycerophosphodiester phosphodiesterase family protein [Pseudodesulfovibrio sp. zrk46]|uniref:glycerophosphodiester phosphodiesterase n=1 Tax=Pseudodesulfovibrio sp. zrk46 TaxID=2725288 RepID=UPI001449D3D3|nr:glycerophosphodiester phosphodiesterase family protein [Pseudodesulfovibrio sp. zrk46]QJB56516.1 glycerophosphodiester phosphodiesterase [Pseudodesulfovibrio sp. zrk46]